MRKALAAVLFAVAGAFALLTFLTLQNLWDDYQDSPDSLYIEVAAITLAIAALATLSGYLALRRR